MGHDVVVVGGGPAGAACAYWLASAGWDVLMVERKSYPREKTCGDGLTPRAVRQLTDMGVGGELAGHHRFDGLRSIAFGRELELRWPDHPDFPPYGYVVPRSELDRMVAERAVKAGATLWQQTEALEPVRQAGLVRGALVRRRQGTSAGPEGSTQEVRARYLVVADGAHAPRSWEISADTSCGPPTGGRLPMSFSVGPTTGPTHVVVGDAAGAINPFNGEGIAYAYETGRMAAAAVAEALSADDGLALQAY